MIKGRCHCDAVTFEITGPVTEFMHCHCQSCRRITGTVFGASAVTKRTDLRVLTGEDLLTPYESSPGKRRMFCSKCGTHVFALQDSYPDDAILRIGVLDEGHGLVPEGHIYYEERTVWDMTRDDLPKYTAEDFG